MKHKSIGIASVVFFLASFFASAQISFATQQVHGATARISVQKYNAKPDCEAPCVHCSLRSSYLSAGEVEEKILSAPILNVVAERLSLAAKWQVNGEELLSMLKDKIQVRQFLSTTDISITATSQDAAEAAAIANEVARAFQEDIEEINRKEKAAAQFTADEKLKAQEALLEQLKQKLQTLRKEHGLSESLFRDDEAVQKLRMEQLKRDRVSTQKELLAAETRLKKFSELKDKSIDEFALVVNDPFMEMVGEQIKQYEKKLREMSPSLGPNHPEVKQVQSALDELNEKRRKAIDGILKGLRAQYIISKKKFDALNQEIEKVEDAPLVIKSPELKQIRAEYDAQKAALDALRKKTFMIQHIRPSCSVEILRHADPTPKNKLPSAFVAAKRQSIQKDSAQKLRYATSRISVLKRPDELLKCKAPCEHCSSKPSPSLRTETAIIKWSRPVLDEVAQQLDLAEKWTMNGIKPSPDDVYSLLRSKLAVQQVGDSSFIDITAASSDAAEAALIANEVARAYQKHVEGIALKEKKRAEEALARELKKLEDKVHQAELKYKEIRKNQGPSELPVAVDKNAEKLRCEQLEKDRIQAKVAMLVAKAKWEQLSESEKVSEEAQKDAEETYLVAKKQFETLGQKLKAGSGQSENVKTRRARQEFEIQKGIYEALKKRVSKMPPPKEKPPSCTVEIVFLAQPEKETE
jgi:uncharacterized protein involved in exopolysaccharide biosynthesis